MIRSFRLQITAWYLLFFSLLMLVFSGILYAALSRALENRMDAMLAAEAETAAALFQSEMKELGGDPNAAARETVSELRVRGVGIAISSAGQVLASTPAWTPKPLHQERGSSRSAERQLGVAGRPYLIVAVAPMEPVSAELAVVRRVLYFTLPVLFLIAGAGGFLLAGRSLRPLVRIQEQTRRITGQSLNQRLEIGQSSQELATLAETFNELLSRLDASFDTMRRFVADASHEMRTPLAVIRGEADVALGRERSPEEYRESLAVIHDESKRLTRLVDDLLNLARADAGHVKLQVQEFYLNDLLSECCRSVQALAAAKDLTLECRCGDDAPFRGDEELLRRLVLNLLDNAIRYTPRQGRVTVLLERAGDLLEIRVSDTGVGIPPEAAPHVFERFYRADVSRSRTDGGFGLGLAIVQWIAESHHGSVGVESTPGAGSTFTVLLPR